MPAVLALIQVVGTTAAARHDGVAVPPLGYALLVAAPAALLLRTWSRPAALVIAVAATTGYFSLGYPQGPGWLAAVVAVIGALRAGHRVLSWIVAVAGYLTFAFAAHPTWRELITLGAWLLVVTALGEAARVRTVHFEELVRARAERERAVADQEKARAEHRRRQASEERLRIARELHDVLGHHLSLINVQAGVGLHLMDDRPEQARAALSAIKQASAEALREVRSVLGALRLDDESPPRAPAPGVSGSGPPQEVAGLRDLVAEVSAAGLPVRLDLIGEPGALPAEVDRAAYRIVQEALTNVRRHAGAGAAATVRLAYGHHELVVDVTDDGPGEGFGDGFGDGPGDGPGEGTADVTATVRDGDDVRDAPAFTGGTGIVGMRQRVAALGGEFRAGPAVGAGFGVHARFPLGGHP